MSYIKIGDILWVTDDWKGALDVYQKGRELNESLVTADPANRAIRDNLSIN